MFCEILGKRFACAFPFSLRRNVDERGRLIGLSRSLAASATCTDFLIGPRSLSASGYARGIPEADLLYPDGFCGDILSYKIADIHRISIEMAADVAATAIGRRASLSRPLRDRLAVGRSAGPLIRPVRSRAQFYRQFFSFKAIVLL